MNDDLRNFEQFMKQRENAARAYVLGQAEPLRQIVTHALPATFFAPYGGYRQGAEQVFSTYELDAKGFEPVGETSFEILQLAASDGVAYWVGFQHATVRMRGKAEVIPMKLRVTEVFRREGNEWKLVHRHADSLVSESKRK